MRRAQERGAGGSLMAVLAMVVSLAACSTTAPGHQTTPSSRTTTPPASGLGRLMPLYPFDSLGQVATWQVAYRGAGQQPWHLSSGDTAVAFAAWLGYPQIDTVVNTVSDSTGDHVSVGFSVGEGTPPRLVTAAVVHLVRWGVGADRPWEVVGTDDQSLTLDQPAYDATVDAPVVAGGVVSGVDESIAVRVLSSQTAAPVGLTCCLAAGGDRTPWAQTVPFSAAPGSVVVLSAATGGHVAAVERFAVTGVRASAGSRAPGAPCSEATMLPVVRAALPLPAPDAIVSVRIDQCGGGYARVQAVPSELRCGSGGGCYQGEQVFLDEMGTQWQVLDNGSGLNCTSPSLPPKDLPACRALGLDG
ncbi:MAG: hypothetical protein ACYDA2_02420 [Acidimicrobiales bacterium]